MSERGAIHLTVAALLLGGTLMLGVAVDVTRVGTAWREVSHLAATAAEAGAGWIDESAAYEGRILIDPDRAEAAALGVAAARGRRVDVDTRPGRICVGVSIRVRPSVLTMVGARATWVRARSCAEPRRVP